MAAVVCRDCGQPGEEDETDLMPNTCPRCFEARIRPAFFTAWSVDELVDKLVAAGCHPNRVRAFIQQQLESLES